MPGDPISLWVAAPILLVASFAFIYILKVSSRWKEVFTYLLWLCDLWLVSSLAYFIFGIAGAFLIGALTLYVLYRVRLARNKQVTTLVSALATWKTIDLGTERTGIDLYNALVGEKGIKFVPQVNLMMNDPSFRVSNTKSQADLAVLTTAQLTGKKHGATSSEVFAGAKRLHLQKCSPEIGPQLRLQYKDQPTAERLLIGMDPILDPDSDFMTFCVERLYSRKLWLAVYYSNPGYLWDGDVRWVFVRRLYKYA